jgi:hypothetical protein
MLFRRIIWDDGNFSPEPDYEVIDDDGEAIGRIYRTVTPSGTRWFWTVYAFGPGPLAATLEDAKAALETALGRVPSGVAHPLKG